MIDHKVTISRSWEGKSRPWRWACSGCSGRGAGKFAEVVGLARSHATQTGGWVAWASRRRSQHA